MLKRYADKWTTPPHAVTERAEDFAAETRDILQALSNRIDREESDLYPLLDRVE